MAPFKQHDPIYLRGYFLQWIDVIHIKTKDEKTSLDGTFFEGKCWQKCFWQEIFWSLTTQYKQSQMSRPVNKPRKHEQFKTGFTFFHTVLVLCKCIYGMLPLIISISLQADIFHLSYNLNHYIQIAWMLFRGPLKTLPSLLKASHHLAHVRLTIHAAKMSPEFLAHSFLFIFSHFLLPNHVLSQFHA